MTPATANPEAFSFVKIRGRKMSDLAIKASERVALKALLNEDWLAEKAFVTCQDESFHAATIRGVSASETSRCVLESSTALVQSENSQFFVAGDEDLAVRHHRNNI